MTETATQTNMDQLRAERDAALAVSETVKKSNDALRMTNDARAKELEKMQKALADERAEAQKLHVRIETVTKTNEALRLMADEETRLKVHYMKLANDEHAALDTETKNNKALQDEVNQLREECKRLAQELDKAERAPNVHGISDIGPVVRSADGLWRKTGEGRKDDFSKLAYDLIPPLAEEAIVEVLTYGAKKYAPENWRKVPEAKRRYFAAARRHLAAHQKGELLDSDSGCPHLAHAACCLMFLIEFLATETK